MAFPKTITRYVITELVKVFAVSLIGFVALMLLIGVVQEAIRKGLDPWSIIRLVPYLLPEALMFAMPATILFSVCCLFGRMSAENEVVALKAAGVSARAAIIPTLFIAFLLSLVGVLLNEIAFTWSYRGVEKVVIESVEPVVYNVLKNNRHFRSKDFAISVSDVRNRDLIEPRIKIHKSDGRTINLTAQSGSIHCDPSNHSLIVSLTGGTLQVGQQATLSFTDTIEHRIRLITAGQAEWMRTNPAHIAMHRIPQEIRQQKKVIERMDQQSAARAAGALLNGDYPEMNNAQWQQERAAATRARQRIDRLRFAPWRRWANGFSCFAFVMLGIPVALRMKAADQATTFAVCFLPVLLFYYPLFMGSMQLARNGSLPPYSIWIANLACVVIGCVALRKEFLR